MKIKKGDQVRIISGKDRGKSGSVLTVYPDKEKLIVEGLNLYKKKVKPKSKGQKGEMVNVARPIWGSKVMLICRSCKKPTRVGYRFEGNQKVRFCRKCEAAT